MSERQVRHHPRMDAVDYDAAGLLNVQCYTCKKFRYVLDRMYRCFDCGVWLCGDCVPDHFGNRHEPHPMHLHEYEAKIERLRKALDQAVGNETWGDGPLHSSEVFQDKAPELYAFLREKEEGNECR